MSLKSIICDFCVVLLLGLTLTFADEKPSTDPLDEGPTGNCSCGGFASATPEADTAPMLSQTPGLVVKCDEEGETTCRTLCTALAMATKAKGPEILCNRLKEANELKLSAFSKICDQPWKYAGMSAKEPLCCAENKVKLCLSAEKLNFTSVDVIDAKTVM